MSAGATLAMRHLAAISATFAVIMSGCANPVQNLADSSRKLELDMAARCRAWDERAQKAANPDAETIAVHERLVKKAADLEAAVSARNLNGDALVAALGPVAQAKIEANAVYDAQSKQKIAADCWRDLEMAENLHRDQRERLAQFGANLAAPARQPPPTSTPDFSIRTLDTQPSPPPSPTPSPDLGAAYVPSTNRLPDQSAFPGPFIGHVPGGPDVYIVPPQAH